MLSSYFLKKCSAIQGKSTPITIANRVIETINSIQREMEFSPLQIMTTMAKIIRERVVAIIVPPIVILTDEFFCNAITPYERVRYQSVRGVHTGN